jgi:hypothetical protein
MPVEDGPGEGEKTGAGEGDSATGTGVEPVYDVYDPTMKLGTSLFGTFQLQFDIGVALVG